MPVYLKPIEKDSIIEMTKEFHSILIVACPGCPNESLAYLRDVPLTKKITISKNHTEIECYAINQEVRRLSKIFQEQGLSVEIEVLNEKYLCLLSGKDCETLKERLPHTDAFFVLGCPAAAEGIKKISGVSSNILTGMRAVALFFYSYKYDTKSGDKYISEVQFAKITKTGEDDNV